MELLQIEKFQINTKGSYLCRAHAEKNFLELKKLFCWISMRIWWNQTNVWLIDIHFLVESTKYSDLVESTKYFVGSTKHFVARIISKFCSWTNQNFVNSTKSFFKLVHQFGNTMGENWIIKKKSLNQIDRTKTYSNTIL